MSVITGMIQNIDTKNVPTDSQYAGPLLAMFALVEGPTELRGDALRVMAAIAARRQHRMQLVELGAIELLLAQLASSTTMLSDVLEGLLQLALDKRSHPRFYSSKSVPSLLSFLRSSTPSETQVTQALTVLNCLLTTAPLRLQLIELDGLSLTADYAISGTVAQQEQAAFALWLLAAIPSIQYRFLSTKALPALVHALEYGTGDLLDTALSALVLLAENEQCREAINDDGVLDILSSIAHREDREEVRSRVELLEELLLAQS